jgi:hypothetical protein
MCAVLNYLEKRPSVERYAWFIPRSSAKVDSPPYMQLLTHDYPADLTDLGRMYCWFSPMNGQYWLRATRTILASEYVSVRNNALPMRPSTDAVALAKAGVPGLMVTNFAEGQALNYQLYVPEATQEIVLRYCGYSNSICEVIVDGASQNYVEMPRNGSSTEWTEASVSLPLAAGKHTITLSLFSGSCYLSALTLQ